MTREAGDYDRRVVRLRLSEEGCALVSEVEAIEQRIDDRLYERLDEADLTHAVEVLRRFVDGTVSGEKVRLRFPGGA